MPVIHFLCTTFLWMIEQFMKLFTKGNVSTGWVYVRNRTARYRFVKSLKTPRNEITMEDIHHKHGHRSHIPNDSNRLSSSNSSKEKGNNGNGNGIDHLPILLIHGIGKSSFDFHPTLKEFIVRQGFHTHHPLVIAPDLPGYGRSKGASLAKGHSITDLADWLDEFLDAIHVDRVHVVGSSAGCQVALAFAKRHSRRASSLVLVSPTLGPNHTFLEYFLNTIKNSIKESHLFNICHLAMWGQMGWINFSMSALKFLGDNPISHAKNLTVPSLIIRGTEDRLVGLSDIDYLVDQLTDKSRPKTSPKLTWKAEIPKGTHNIPFEQPHEFVEILLPFLARREKESRLEY